MPKIDIARDQRSLTVAACHAWLWWKSRGRWQRREAPTSTLRIRGRAGRHCTTASRRNSIRRKRDKRWLDALG